MRAILAVLAVCLVGGDLASARHHRRIKRPGRFRIVSGRTANIDEFPYQVSLEHYGRQFCGGSILSESVVITAAHCVQSVKNLASIPEDLMHVRVGADYSGEGGHVYAIRSVLPHERYGEDPESNDHDIALIFLQDKIRFDRMVQPVQFTTVEPEDGKMAWVTGYGVTKEMRRESRIRGRRLLAIEVPIMNLAKCQKIYGDMGLLVTENMICAGHNTGHRDSCKGDSGGPMVADGKLIGIVAWGIGCGREGVPGVYTNVAVYSPWIEANMNRLRRRHSIDVYRAVFGHDI